MRTFLVLLSGHQPYVNPVFHVKTTHRRSSKDYSAACFAVVVLLQVDQLGWDGIFSQVA